MGGARVEVTASTQSIAGMVTLTDPEGAFDMNPVKAGTRSACREMVARRSWSAVPPRPVA